MPNASVSLASGAIQTGYLTQSIQPGRSTSPGQIGKADGGRAEGSTKLTARRAAHRLDDHQRHLLAMDDSLPAPNRRAENVEP